MMVIINIILIEGKRETARKRRDNDKDILTREIIRGEWGLGLRMDGDDEVERGEQRMGVLVREPGNFQISDSRQPRIDTARSAEPFAT